VDAVAGQEGGQEQEEEEEEEEEERGVEAILSKQGSGSLLLEDAEAEAAQAAPATNGHRPPVFLMARNSSHSSSSGSGSSSKEASAIPPLLPPLLDGEDTRARRDFDLAHHDLPFFHMLRVLGSPGAAVFLVFAVTLAVFPSLTVHVVSTARCAGKGVFYDKGFVPFQFLLFNACDFLGRCVLLL
jgi:hypothetical protein